MGTAAIIALVTTLPALITAIGGLFIHNAAQKAALQAGADAAGAVAKAAVDAHNKDALAHTSPALPAPAPVPNPHLEGKA